MDVHEPEVRSYNMSRIRSKDTKPELLVRKFLFSKGFRYRLHAKELPGKPDIVLPKHKTVIFVHGCFWHGHQKCKYGRLPKTRTKWWKEKIERNALNDKRKTNELRRADWMIIKIWECQLKPKKIISTLNSLEKRLQISM